MTTPPPTSATNLPDNPVVSLNTSRISQLARSVLNGSALAADDALFLINLEYQNTYDLLYWANRIARHHFGNQISLCSIVSARTGACPEDCRFCAQSTHHATNITTQVADTQTIVKSADTAIANGAHCFGIVAAGRGPTDDQIDSYEPALRKITATNAKIKLCASLGCLTEPQAHRLHDLGVRRYNHNLETSESFFPQVVTTHHYADRLATVRAAKAAGMEVCCGGIIGMGETGADRVDLALQIRELDVDTVPLNFLHPIAGTALADASGVGPLAALQTIAMFRFVLPAKPIKIAGGRESCLRDLQSWMFYAGATGCMIGDYLTTGGRAVADDLQMFTDLGMSCSPPTS